MPLIIGRVYFFDNDRGTNEVCLKVTGESEMKYECEYFDDEGYPVRNSVFNKKGGFCRNLRSEPMRDFYIVWVEGGPCPVRRKYATIGEAKKACEYLVEQKGVKEVFIMKKVGVAKVPSRVKFEIDE